MKIILFFFCLNAFAQNLKVEYNAQLNTLERNGFLFILSGKTPFYFEQAVLNEPTVEPKNKNEDENSLVFTVNSDISKKWYQIYPVKNDTLYNVDYIDEKTMMYYDVFETPKWTLTEDEKKISGYNCIKAFTHFRGRNFTAWFTPEIPVNFGPWKFRGLPGLILEIYDEEKNFTWYATKISKDVFFSEFYPDYKNKTKLSFKEFTKLKDIDNQEEINKVMLRFSDSNIILLDQKIIRGRELKYDWEN